MQKKLGFAIIELRWMGENLLTMPPQTNNKGNRIAMTRRKMIQDCPGKETIQENGRWTLEQVKEEFGLAANERGEAVRELVDMHRFGGPNLQRRIENFANDHGLGHLF